MDAHPVYSVFAELRAFSCDGRIHGTWCLCAECVMCVCVRVCVCTCEK